MESLIKLTFAAFVFSFAIAVAAFKLWLIGSVITSGVKALSDDCGTKYGIEKVVSGNWFCPDTE